MRILIIDDNRKLGAILAEIAGKCGFDVSVLDNPVAFLLNYNDYRPDVVFLDIFMPEADGFEVIDFFREQKVKAKVILMSGDAEFCSMANAMGGLVGVNIVATLHKPFRIGAVRDMLMNINPHEDMKELNYA